MEEKFLELFKQVFDSSGNVKPCGRNLCAELIKVAQQILPLPFKDYYGDSDSASPHYGYMNTEHIISMYNWLTNKSNETDMHTCNM